MIAVKPHLAAIPSVDRLLQHSAAEALIERYGRELTLTVLREQIERLRWQLTHEEVTVQDFSEQLLENVREHIESLLSPGLKTVFNLTGTVLHTNLGRAPLPPEAIAAISRVAAQASNLEFDLAGGKRGDRDNHVEHWLCRLTGAEAATVVNNNAAAVLLVLNTLALRKQVPVSRGELVEIGGSFRMPDIMARAGCRLVEVGTTNRTHRRDYIDAINPATALLLRVHTSNYEIQGFTASVGESELVAIAREHHIPLFHDLGSGSLIDLGRLGLSRETTPMDSVKNGVDLISFSGDKLLGGPQCGIIIGKRELIAPLKKNPLKRALRCDKMTLAALQALLPLYADPERVCQRVPALRLLSRSQADIEAAAQRLLPLLQPHCIDFAEVSVVPCHSQIGSGALPVAQLASAALALNPLPQRKGRALQQLAAAFRGLPQPVLGRIHEDTLLFDLRCLENPDEKYFLQQLTQLRLA
jgi:L-seryl-tRNA(Ser) seleniumtransferase